MLSHLIVDKVSYKLWQSPQNNRRRLYGEGLLLDQCWTGKIIK